MAVQGPFKVNFNELLPHGAFAVAVDAQQDFDKAQAGVEDPQARDKDTGERVWVVRVIDNDPDARSNEFKVKVIAAVCPSLPEPLPGTNFRPVTFENLLVTPYVEETRMGRSRVAYSLKATGVSEPRHNPKAATESDSSAGSTPSASTSSGSNSSTSSSGKSSGKAA